MNTLQKRLDKCCYHCERFDWQCDGKLFFTADPIRPEANHCTNRKDTPNAKCSLQVQAFQAIYKGNRRTMSKPDSFADAVVATCDDRFEELKSQPGGLLANIVQGRRIK